MAFFEIIYYFKDLIEIGKKKKYITFEQLADALKGLEIDNDSLDEIYNTLMENEIQVVADEDEATDEDGVPKVIEEEPYFLLELNQGIVNLYQHNV